VKDTADIAHEAIVFQSNLFDYRKGSISKNNGEEIFMEHRLKELLFILLRHKNNFVSQEDLMAFVWKDVIVSNQSVSKAISDLRKFFASNQIENQEIITVRKVGYKLKIKEPVNDSGNPLKRLLKVLIYMLGIIITVIIIIRAIRYDQ